MGKKSKKKKVIHENDKKVEIKDYSSRNREREKGLSTWQIASLFLLVIVPFLIYFNSFHNGFVFDDIPLIWENPGIRSLSNIPNLLWGGVGTGGISYRPLRFISYAVDYYFWGLNPVGYHLSNILFHIATTFLVFGVVFLLVGSYWCAILSALFFSLNPVQTDSVTYISGRRDILCALFYLAGFYFFLRYREIRKVRYLLLTFFSYILSLSSKEMGVTLPLLLFIYDYFEVKSKEKGVWRSFKEVWSRYYFLYLPVFLVGIWFTYYKLFINYPSTRHEYYGGNLVTNFLTVGKILVYYLKLIFLPVVLNADYSYNAFPLSQGLFEPATFTSLLILGMIFYLIYRLLTGERVIAFGLLWFFIAVLPVCQIFPHHELLAEHYLYLPIVGISLGVGYVMGELIRGYKFKQVLIGCYLVVLILFGVRVFDRNRDWKDGLTLWSKTVSTAPQCARALDNLGVEYYNLERYREAIPYHERAIRLKPDYAIAYYNLGNAYNHSNLCDKAISAYQQSIRLKPDNIRAYNNLGVAYKNCKLYREAVLMYHKVLEREPGNRSAINNMGVALNSINFFKVALPWCEKAVALNHRDVMALQNLGVALSGLGDHERALSVLQSALALNPRNTDIHVNLGSVYRRMGDDKKATEEYQLALKMNPKSAEALNNLGVVYNSKSHYDQAIDAYQKALSLDPNDARIYCNLGAVYAEKGDYRQAIALYQEAIKFDPRYSKTYSNLGAAYKNLKMYDEAITWYRSGLEKAQRDPVMHFNLGVVYRNKGMEKEAISEYEEALRLKPEYADPHLRLSAIYLKDKKSNEALNHLKRYLRLAPNSPQADSVRKIIAELEQVK
jgi:tetratricopeptide (TPR) repeat protein